MNNTMEYKSYSASVEYNNDDKTFYGKVIGINDLIVFEGASYSELKNAFKKNVDSYLEMCRLNNKIPEKTYKGTFNVRIPAETHKRLAFIAAAQHKTLNNVVSEVLTDYCSVI